MNRLSPSIDLIIPVRSLADGKRRLRILLTDAQRQALNQQFLAHILALARQLPRIGRTWVVSGCPRTRDVAHSLGACVLAEPPDTGRRGGPEARLNDALGFALAQVRKQGARNVLLVSSDLPFAQAEDLDMLCRLGQPRTDHTCVIATDKTGQGTNAIFIPERHGFEFSFGPESCGRHANSARRHGMQTHIARISNLAHDIDTPDDYLFWRSASACLTASPTLSGGTVWMHNPPTNWPMTPLTASR
ncbi:MAG: 2-phospho-L-lactate guanylyltransferase [Pusillimonas sp.]